MEIRIPRLIETGNLIKSGEPPFPLSPAEESARGRDTRARNALTRLGVSSIRAAFLLRAGGGEKPPRRKSALLRFDFRLGSSAADGQPRPEEVRD